MIDALLTALQYLALVALLFAVVGLTVCALVNPHRMLEAPPERKWR